MNFELTNPCKDCPFRTDKPNQQHWLGEARAKEICESLIDNQQNFQCHKTNDLPTDKHQHCAGAMIMLEHIQKPNQMMRISERLGFYDHRKLNMKAPIFTSPFDFIKWHK